MEPQRSLAIIEAKVSVKTMVTKKPKDNLGHKDSNWYQDDYG
jgi:hypothetical protein